MPDPILRYYDYPVPEPDTVHVVLHGDNLDRTALVRVRIRGNGTHDTAPEFKSKEVVVAVFPRPNVLPALNLFDRPGAVKMLAGDIDGTIDVLDDGNRPSNGLPFSYKVDPNRPVPN
jgi:hypothetical protein